MRRRGRNHPDRTGERSYACIYVNFVGPDPGYCGVFSGDDASGYKYIVATAGPEGDARNVQNMLREEFGAKGGGSKAMIQGSMSGTVISDVIAKCEALQ